MALRQLAVAYPDNKSLLYAMALCLEGLERLEDAVQLCDRLIREFHYDNAVILKARLVTTPTANEDRGNGWPRTLDIQEQNHIQSAVAVGEAHTPARWYAVAAIGISGALAFFVLAVNYLAQADTVVPGALPTLFPMRLLTFFILTVIAEVAVIFYCSAKLQQQNGDMLLLRSMICGVLFCIPLPGWLLTTWILRKHFQNEYRLIALITALAFGCCLLTAWIGAYTLDLTDPLRIYRELEAGYG